MGEGGEPHRVLPAALQGWSGWLLGLFILVEGTEAQEGGDTCPRPHRQEATQSTPSLLREGLAHPVACSYLWLGSGRPGTQGCHTQRHADAVALGVEEAPDLGEVAVEAPVVLVHGGLEQEGVAGVEDAGDALLCALDKHAGLLRLHVVPHPLVRLVS